MSDIAEFIAACERVKASLRKAIDACNRAVAEIEGGASMPRHRPFGTACSDCKGIATRLAKQWTLYLKRQQARAA